LFALSILLGIYNIRLNSDKLMQLINSAQMITTAVNVASDGVTVISNGGTYGILLAILFAHGIVCSAATSILARLNLFYVAVNGEYTPLSSSQELLILVLAVFVSWNNSSCNNFAVGLLWKTRVQSFDQHCFYAI
jgi:uncharacterized membrane protein